MLKLDGVAAGYGRVPVLEGIGFEIADGETIAIGGPNGAGKSTLLKVLAGSLAPQRGSIEHHGVDITATAVPDRLAAGIILCPEGRRIFSSLSIEENLRLGAIATAARKDFSRKQQIGDDLERIYALFPILKTRRKDGGGTLSGGQQQMLAIGRALMGHPRLLLLDEPSLGLSPIMADEIYGMLAALRGQDMAMIIVEEAAGRPLAIADRGLLMRGGQIVRSERAAVLRASSDFTTDYLGHAA